MPSISQRGQEMPQSPIRKLAPLAMQAKSRGIHVYHLNIGQPDLPTPAPALDAMKNIDRKVLEYSPSQGFLSLRKKMVSYYAKYDINVTEDDIIVTSGGSEAVLFAFMSTLNPGDEILITEPFYANYLAFAISCGAVIKTIATTIEEGFCLPRVEKMEELITPRTRAIMICNPNNPTGYLYTKQEMMQIRDLVKKYNLYLFSNTNAINYDCFVPYLRAKFGFDFFPTLFKAAYFSHILQIRKPKPEGFQRIIEEQRLNPSETLFIDDSPQHIAGASQCGLRTHHLHNDEKIESLCYETL